MQPTIPKHELKHIMYNFLSDLDRGISVNLFAEIAGLSPGHIHDVFVYQTEPLTEYVQRRVSKAYKAWVNGEVAIMQNRDNTKFVQYRKEAKPLMQRSLGLKVTNDGIKINLGIKTKYDYSGYTLDDQLKGDKKWRF